GDRRGRAAQSALLRLDQIINLRREIKDRLVDALQRAQGSLRDANVVARDLDVVIVFQRAADGFIERQRDGLIACDANPSQIRQRRNGLRLRVWKVWLARLLRNTRR